MPAAAPTGLIQGMPGDLLLSRSNAPARLRRRAARPGKYRPRIGPGVARGDTRAYRSSAHSDVELQPERIAHRISAQPLGSVLAPSLYLGGLFSRSAKEEWTTRRRRSAQARRLRWRRADLRAPSRKRTASRARSWVETAKSARRRRHLPLRHKPSKPSTPRAGPLAANGVVRKAHVST